MDIVRHQVGKTDGGPACHEWTGVEIVGRMAALIPPARKRVVRYYGALGPMMNRRQRRRYLGARPSKKAMEHIRTNVSETLWRGRSERWEVIRDELNRKLQGWANYFAYGSPYASFRLVDIHVADRVRNLLRRRHHLPR